MRRIINNSTAIVACLSLLAPHAAMAQTAEAEAQTEMQAQTDPVGEAAEAAAQAAESAEAAAEAAVDALCTDGAAPPCPPAAEAEAAPAEAEAEAAPAEAEAQPQAEPEVEAEAEVSESSPAQPEAAAEADAEAAAEMETTAEPAVEATPEPVIEEQPVVEEPPAPAEAAAPAEPAETAATPEPAADASAEDQADALAEALADEAEEQAPETATTEAPAETQPAAAETTDADALAEALAAEEAAAGEAEAEAEAAPAAQPEAPAEAQAVSETPVTDEAATDAAAAGTAPEQGAVETEAAAEAAAATEASAAALNDDAAETADAEVIEEAVTEENSRSSAEDFATSLQEALNATNGDQQAAAAEDDDDDKSDLTKAVLLGLGGLAVGAMLANNRQVALSSPDRVVVTRSDGSQQVIKDEVALLRQPGSTVSTQNFDDGSSRTIVTRADGSKVVTIRDADLRVLRRTLISADGTSVQLIDDTTAQPVDIASLPAPAAVATSGAGQLSEDQLRTALLTESASDRRFTLAQIRDIPQVRSLVAPVDINAITFDTGSAAIKPDQAKDLSALGNVIRDAVARNPREIFMIEGHTDTVGDGAMNLALSDRRAESVALALTEYFQVPPENMVVQGYGEQFLKVRQEGDIRENRRASVRRITELLQQAQN
ncbi:OmpA family protein [Paracoccus sp. M683]|uniref:OmpA family protein n=1 Tax=Paracoccus sp. M683 TaxID=2594268 RepID=UPI00117EB4EA|nr:OmpA family protein [Paracoccus sp. M683]TRW96621.1 OmpA family protein [Paracoccus sp. M683]